MKRWELFTTERIIAIIDCSNILPTVPEYRFSLFRSTPPSNNVRGGNVRLLVGVTGQLADTPTPRPPGRIPGNPRSLKFPAGIPENFEGFRKLSFRDSIPQH